MKYCAINKFTMRFFMVIKTRIIIIGRSSVVHRKKVFTISFGEIYQNFGP